MSEEQEIEQQMEFTKDLRRFLYDHITNPDQAFMACHALTFEATRLAWVVAGKEPSEMRNVMVAALNLSLKHATKL